MGNIGGGRKKSHMCPNQKEKTPKRILRTINDSYTVGEERWTEYTSEVRKL